MGANKRIHPLPEWFDLAKYDVFLGVKNEVIFDEIVARALIYSNVDNPMSYLGDGIRVLESGDLFVGRAIRAAMARSMKPDSHESEPFISALLDPELMRHFRPELYSDIPPLSHGVAINLINGFGLRELYISLIHTGAIQRPSEATPDQLNLHLGKMSASVTKTLSSNLIYTALNLTKATDVELIQEFAELLPTWREQMGIPEPDKSEGDKEGGSMIKRIVEYQAIAMLDLLLWSKLAKLHKGYTNPQLSEILYPDEVNADPKMPAARKKFALQFCKHDQQDRMNMWLGLIGRDGRYNRDRLVRDEFPPTE